nr:hypothetical protein [Tanacetum cinerariifolium]
MTTLADKAILPGADNRPPVLEKDMYDSWKTVVTSRFPTTNNQLRNSLNPRKQATINDGRVTLQPLQGRQISFATSTSRTYTPAASGSNSGKQRTIICYNCKREGHMSKQCTKPKMKRDDSWFKDKVLLNAKINRLKQTLSKQLQEKESLMKTATVLKNDFKKEESRNIDREITLEKKIKHLDNIVYKRDQSAQTIHMLTKPKFFYDHSIKQALGFQNSFYLKKGQQLEPKLYDGNVIKNTCAIVIPDSVETLMLAEESRSKMLLKQQDPMVLEKKVNTKPVDYNYMNSLDHNHSKRPTKVDVPKVSMAVEQYRLELKTFKIKMNQVLNENERLLEQIIYKDIVNNFVNSSVDNASQQGLIMAALRDELRKLKGKAIVDTMVSTYTIDPEMLKVDEQVTILREVVEYGKSQNPLDDSLDHA